MRKIKYQLLIALTFLGFLDCNSQNFKVLYHSYQGSDSVNQIKEWNVSDTTNQRFLVKETLDVKNRVIRLQYLVDGEVKEQNPMYGITNFYFEYGENFIIEYYLDYKGKPLTLLDDEMPTSRKYYLNKKNEIVDCETTYSIEFKELTKNKLREVENSLKFWRENVIEEIDSSDNNECEMNYVFGYLFSYSKMDGTFPKKEKFAFDFDQYKSELSKEIIGELKKKYKP